jgi:hypothetical protein
MIPAFEDMCVEAQVAMCQSVGARLEAHGVELVDEGHGVPQRVGGVGRCAGA